MLGGDLNAQWTDPRTGEADLIQDWMDTLHSLGVSPLPYTGHSFYTDHGGSQIDFLAVPAGSAGTLDCHARWTAFSDHAPLCSSPAHAVGRRDLPMTPAMFQTLGEGALADLRRRLRTLEGTFRLQRLVATPQLPAFRGPEQPGDCPRQLSLLDDDGGAGFPGDVQADGGEAAALHPPSTEALPEAGGRSILDESPWDPRLAEFGQRALHATLTSWWRDCQRRSPTCVGFLLRQAARSAAPTPVVGNLLAWLQARGFTPSPAGRAADGRPSLLPRDAAAWLTVWRLDAAVARRARLRPWLVGPGTQRPTLPEHYRLGRMVYGRLPPVTHVKDDQGTTHDRPEDMDEVLWGSRKDIWGTAPPLPARAASILDYYFRDRPALPDIPPPSTAAVLGHILRPGGSAPGHDGVCYEPLHYAINMVAHLLAQAIHAAAMDSPLLDVILGPSVDLLVWIVKSPGADTPAGLRPLQLPSCFRRLFGAVVAGATGPIVEPHLCTHQAAIAGGTCGPNISAAFRHLADVPASTPSPAGAPALAPSPSPCDVAWKAALGQWSDKVNDYCATASGRSALGPNDRAILFADQNKAFERLSFAWLAMVLTRWGFPPWVLRGLLALTLGRAVTAARGGPSPPVRALARSIGMGGTASPLTWSIGYDPIIHVTSRAAGAPTPTYVDDLAALLAGASQTLRASYALVFASQAAGLVITGHSCQALHIRDISPAGLAALHDLPVTITKWADTVSVTGLPSDLLASALGVTAPSTQRVARRCDCAIKTALVPAAKPALWAALLAATPFAESAVQDCWPYLGVTVGAPGPRPPPVPRRGRRSRRHMATLPPGRHPYTDDALDRVRAATWAKPTAKAKFRVSAAAVERLSPGRRAHIWNAYTLSLLPYPSTACTPCPSDAAAWSRLFRDAISAGPWCPVRALSALSVVYGISGAPRCPTIYTKVCQVLAHVHGRYCGPPGCNTQAEGILDAASRWCAAYHAPRVSPLDRTVGRATRDLLAWRRARLFAPGTRPPGTLGHTLYTVLWARAHLAAHQCWFSLRCRGRRWAPGQGLEAAILRQCRSYTAGHHVLRFLVNGMPGGHRWRPTPEHRTRNCSACGAPGHTSWLAPQCCGSDPPHHPGYALCRPCSQGWHRSDQWALLPDAHIPPALHPRARSIRATRGSVMPVPVDTRCRWGCCPLCGLGEAGAEHLLGWCPAVAAAWYQLYPSGRSLTDTVLQPRADARLVAHFLHQVCFLHSATMGRAVLSAPDAALRIARATAASTTDDPDDSALDSSLTPGRPAPTTAAWEEVRRRTTYAAWTTRPPQCPSCTLSPPPRRTVLATAADVRRSAQLGAHHPELRAAAAASCPPGTRLAVLWADTQPAAWCVPGEGWMAEPRATHTPSASWSMSQCRACGAHRAILLADQPLGTGCEITVPFRISLRADDSNRPVAATFDGGARRVRGAWHSGAGATLWSRSPDGPPRCVAMAFLALPHSGNAQLAEAMGGRLVMNLLRASSAPRKSACIAGDNLQAVRFCAGTSRLHNPSLHEHLDQGLSDLAVEGWSVIWQAVRRRLNRAADRCATAALYWAASLASRSPSSPRAFVLWRDSPSPLPEGLASVAWPSHD